MEKNKFFVYINNNFFFLFLKNNQEVIKEFLKWFTFCLFLEWLIVFWYILMDFFPTYWYGIRMFGRGLYKVIWWLFNLGFFLFLNAPVVGTAWGASLWNFMLHERAVRGYWHGMSYDCFWFIHWYWNFFFDFVIPQFFDQIKTSVVTFIYHLGHDYIIAETIQEKIIAILKIFIYIVFNIIFFIFILTNYFFGADILNFVINIKEVFFDIFFKIITIIKDIFK